VSYVVGTHGSTEALAVAPLAERSKTVFLVIGAQVDDLSHIGPHVLRVIHNTSQEAPFFAKFVAKKMTSDTLHFLMLQSAITPSY